MGPVGVDPFQSLLFLVFRVGEVLSGDMRLAWLRTQPPRCSHDRRSRGRNREAGWSGGHRSPLAPWQRLLWPVMLVASGAGGWCRRASYGIKHQLG